MFVFKYLQKCCEQISQTITGGCVVVEIASQAVVVNMPDKTVVFVDKQPVRVTVAHEITINRQQGIKIDVW